MKILFIRPNKDAFGFKPIGISLLSAICKREGHETALLDTTYYELGYENTSHFASRINIFKPVNWSGYNVAKEKVDLREQTVRALQRFNPDICAFSVLSDEHLIAGEISGYIKEHDQAIPVIWGGKYPTVAPDEAINNKSVDYLCIGEGIEAFPELLTAIDNGKDTTGIRNIIAKENGKIHKNSVRPSFADLDALPFLDWEIFDRREFLKPFDGNVVIGGDWMSNWGCPYSCTYCINNWLNQSQSLKVRRYSPERAVSELRHLKESYGLTFIRFHDEDFLMRPIEHLKEFARLYKEEIGLPFTIETNPKTVTREKVAILKEMGIASASIAIESGNRFIREKVLKRQDTIDDVMNAFHYFYDLQIQTTAYNMIGLPYEDRDKIFDTIELNRLAKPTVVCNVCFFPFEKTELFDVSVKEGFYVPNEATVFSSGKPALTLPGMSEDELVMLQRCFTMYAKLPKSFYKLIERAEVNDEVGNEIYNLLSIIYNERVFQNGGYFSE